MSDDKADSKGVELPHAIDQMGVRVAWIVMLVYAFTVIAPFVLVYYPPSGLSGDLLDIIKSNKSTVDLITTAVVMFYFGASVQRRRDQDTVNTLVRTNAAQVAKLAPVAGMEEKTEDVDKEIEVAPGDVVKVEGVDK